MKVRHAVLFALSVILATTGAIGEDVPFASPPPPMAGRGDVSDLVSLGDIMALVELRHIKLWYAGQSRNWDLVGYEIDRINESLRRSAILYTNIPVAYIKAVGGPMAEMRDAAGSKSAEKFAHGYAGLTAACNACHTAGRVGFLHIQTPTWSPFSDESYER